MESADLHRSDDQLTRGITGDTRIARGYYIWNKWIG